MTREGAILEVLRAAGGHWISTGAIAQAVERRYGMHMACVSTYISRLRSRLRFEHVFVHGDGVLISDALRKDGLRGPEYFYRIERNWE